MTASTRTQTRSTKATVAPKSTAATKATTEPKARRTAKDVAAKQPTELHQAFVAWLEAEGLDLSTMSPAQMVMLSFTLHDEYQASPANKARNAAARAATAAKQADRLAAQEARLAKQLANLQARKEAIAKATAK